MLPLEGVRLLELGQNLAGPFCAQILGYLGADVVKVERPGAGDDARHWGPPFVDGDAAIFHAVNQNKRSVSVDLKSQADLDWLLSTLGDYDVLVQNLRAGVMEDLGLTAERLLACNPRLIYCAINAYGRSGPMKDKPGYEPIVQAFSGLMMVSGENDGPPVRLGTQVLDHGTGIWSALGILAALQKRERTGKGGVVDASLFDTAMVWQAVHYSNFVATGALPDRHPTGSPRLVVFEAVDCADGPLVVSAGNDRLFKKLALAVGKPDWATDPRMEKNTGRREHREEIMSELRAIMRTRSRAEWSEILDIAGVPCAPVNRLDAVVEDPQFEAADMARSIPDLDHRVIGLPLRFDGERPSIRRRTPKSGEHTAEIRGTDRDAAD